MGGRGKCESIFPVGKFPSPHLSSFTKVLSSSVYFNSKPTKQKQHCFYDKLTKHFYRMEFLLIIEKIGFTSYNLLNLLNVYRSRIKAWVKIFNL